jgi:hypothetical protein
VGENENQPLYFSFGPSASVDFQGLRVTSDGGPILIQDLNERLGSSKRKFRII